MKKVIMVSLLLGLLVSSVFAMPSGFLPLGVGGKYAAMGGAGASIVNDITCSYYNPAGILNAGNMELKIGAGAATAGLNDLIAAIGNSSDPAKFLSDNFNKTINVSGGLNSIVGLNVAKVGITIIPVASLILQKAPGLNPGDGLTATANYEGILTLGYGLSIPGIPIAGLNLGANIKSVNSVMGTSTVVNATTSSDNVITYSGLGFDIGAQANINTLVVPLSIGLVYKDIGETLKGKVKAVTTTYDATGGITNQTQTETDGPDVTMPTTLVIGASTVIPGVGLRVAADIDNVSSSSSAGNPSYSVTHIGVEYPLLGIIALRAGTVSGGTNGNISQTTLGAGFNLGAVINVAMMTDAKNSKNNSTMADLGFAF
jgi:hypothetical protein